MNLRTLVHHALEVVLLNLGHKLCRLRSHISITCSVHENRCKPTQQCKVCRYPNPPCETLQAAQADTRYTFSTHRCLWNLVDHANGFARALGSPGPSFDESSITRLACWPEKRTKLRLYVCHTNHLHSDKTQPASPGLFGSPHLR